GKRLVPTEDAPSGPASQQRTLPVSPMPASLKPLNTALSGYKGRVLLTAETAGRRESWLEHLLTEDIKPKPVSSYAEFARSEAPLAITVGPLESGFCLDSPAMMIIPEAALFDLPVEQRGKHTSAPQRDPDTIIRDLTDLHIGSPVVHEQHGVGRYRGLQTISVDGIETEFLQLEYAGNDKLYVPVASLHLIGRYTGADEVDAPLHRLGSGQWEKARKKAAEKARDVAAELLDINARRASQPGIPHQVPEDEYARFSAQFPFEETPDQAVAIHAVLQDMKSSTPMDRVVCGDVGFGKTEVAMRAAFAGVQSGRQVAVLVPTTLLAQQHYQNFADRFADWPVRIEALSRFRSAKETEQVIEALEDGKVDIVIGTHKLLQRSVKFHDLGLLIIDEEQRFGVRQKEKLKEFRATVDVLTLTATPIPRTLNMSLAGLRDLSIIATPPARRLAVKTFVNEWSDATIREACLRELHRGGQVYFLHNDVQSINRIAESLAELVPEARIRVAHGQMRERELERVMLDFYHRRFNVLVCTTIIESGIDVPSANTIVINRADRLGLAQLHQLRGRVGRSHHRAYAYLMAPSKRNLTPDAAKRLEAIASLEDLGIGFALASHDLEIRGAGELLGEGQSGQIHEVGFTLYNDLLERAVKALKSGKQPELEIPLSAGTEIDLHIPALLPTDYLPDVHTRLTLYKRIASAETADALRELQIEMIDRFGLLPPAAKNLMVKAQLRQKAKGLGIERIEAGPGGGVITFGKAATLNVGALIQLVQENPAVYRLEGQERLRFHTETETPEQRIEVVTTMLNAISLPQAA
ncbi:MAG: transcription-repair coupling factor, partial [Gammaproteobacteria bacterium]|nr:transcription-repair coupling factor [Gammaproteobacteria bacterium]